jgi:hypothetical protein
MNKKNLFISSLLFFVAAPYVFGAEVNQQAQQTQQNMPQFLMHNTDVRISPQSKLNKLEKLYSKLKKEHTITYKGAIESGACEAGVKGFIALCEIKKDSLTSTELMDFVRKIYKSSPKQFEDFAPHFRVLLLNMLEEEIVEEKGVEHTNSSNHENSKIKNN